MTRRRAPNVVGALKRRCVVARSIPAPYVVALAALVFLAGCTAPESQDVMRFGGSFTEAATQADMEDFRARMAAHGADDVLLMESFPVQFNVVGLAAAACPDARAEAASLAYVADTRECEPGAR